MARPVKIRSKGQATLRKSLRSRKRPEESFSEELTRLLGSPKPLLREFLDIVAVKDGRRVAAAIEALRAEDRETEAQRSLRQRTGHGRRA
jgi:predicted CopG family antitoxin